MIFEDPNRFYYVSSTYCEPQIYLVDLEAGTEEIVFNDPRFSKIEDIYLLPSAISRRISTIPPMSGRVNRRLFAPDLIVSKISIGKPNTTKKHNKNIHIPVRVTIKNQGTGNRKQFKISITTKVQGTKKPVPVSFTVTGQRENRFIWQKGMGKLEEMSFTGFIELKRSENKPLSGKKITITAIVDSCEGEKFSTKACRVAEADESNNKKSLTFRLPSKISTAKQEKPIR